MTGDVQSELATALRRCVEPMIEAAIAEAIAPLQAELAALKRTPERQAWKDRREAAAYLSCSTTKIDDMAANGRLPKHKLDGKPLFHIDDLDTLFVLVTIEDDELP